jgi:hypothetical protein
MPSHSLVTRLAITSSVTLILIISSVTGRYAVDSPSDKNLAAAALDPSRPSEEFPPDLVKFATSDKNPVFTAEGNGFWDVKIRERGWILHEGNLYHLWFTGYDGTRNGIRTLGYATSPDGLTWTRHPANPLDREHWIEDMMVVKQGKTYYMFAEGLNDQAQLLTSADGVHWDRVGTLDIRYVDGKPLSPGPFGTPTAWFEDGTWYLFYERADKGVWLAKSRDLKIWTNVQDEPVLAPGPEPYDREMIALNQIVKYKGRYYAYYHGSGTPQKPRLWTTDVATSTDLIHWQKYPGNPLFPEAENKSSGILVDGSRQFRLYTMHDSVQVHFPQGK